LVESGIIVRTRAIALTFRAESAKVKTATAEQEKKNNQD